MDRKQVRKVHCSIVLLCLVKGLEGHLLPHALEDVHAFVQSELHRSQAGGRHVNLEGAPSGVVPVFQATQTFIGTPITIQKEVRFNGNGGIQGNGDLNTSPSQSFPQVVNAPDDLPRGLIPPVPLVHPQPLQQQTAASEERPTVVQANGVGPSTFVTDAVRENRQRPPPLPVLSQPLQQRQPQQHQPQQHQPQQHQPQQHQQQQQISVAAVSLQPQHGHQDIDKGKTMEGWIPLDGEGSSLAKAVGVKLHVTEEKRQPEPKQQQKQVIDPSYRGVSYTIRAISQKEEDKDATEEENNDIDIVQTNSVKLSQLRDIIAATKKVDLREREVRSSSQSQPQQAQLRYPIYPRNFPEVQQGAPKVVIHAQNVIIRGADQENAPLNITATSPAPPPPPTEEPNNTNNVKAVPAYVEVPQLNNFLRDQLRFAALNQLFQSQLQGQLQLPEQPAQPIQHPLTGQQFPRPLSLREIAQAARNGQFPPDSRQDPLLQQPSLISPSELQFTIPHVVKMNPDQVAPDALPLPSIHAQQKLALPGVGLGNLYKNILQQEVQGHGHGGVFDPREQLEYSLLAALSGQRLKVPSPVPTFKSKPHTQSDYGDSVAYSEKDPKEKVKIYMATSAKENQGDGGALNTGSLRQMQDHLLKQLLLQELQEEVNEEKLRRPQQQVLLTAGQLPLHRPGLLKPSGVRSVPYGTNAHPFAYLAEENAGAPGEPQEHVFEETFEYTLPPGANVEDYLSGDLKVGGPSYRPKKRPRGPPPHHPHYSFGPPGLEDDDPDTMPLNKDTIMQFGKGLLSSALQFSRHHNPLTVLSRIRNLPPVKVDLYKVPMGIPEDIIPEKWRSGGSSPYGSGRGGKRKHLPRKSNPKYY